MVEQCESGPRVIYEGWRRRSGPGACEIMRCEYDRDGRPIVAPLDPKPSQDVYNHSPNGFEFGYGGSGPAQLALAIILDATGDADMAVRYHQEFKDRFVSSWQHSFKINADQVRRFVELRQTYETIGTEGN